MPATTCSRDVPCEAAAAAPLVAATEAWLQQVPAGERQQILEQLANVGALAGLDVHDPANAQLWLVKPPSASGSCASASTSAKVSAHNRSRLSTASTTAAVTAGQPASKKRRVASSTRVAAR